VTALTAKVLNGRVKFDERVDLPEGIEVQIRSGCGGAGGVNFTVDLPEGIEVQIRIEASGENRFDDDAEGTTPESIERWIARLEAIPKPEVSEEEWAEMERRRLEVRTWELANAEKREAVLMRAVQ